VKTLANETDLKGEPSY